MAKSDTLFKSAGICTHTKGAISITKVRYGTDFVRRVKFLSVPGNVKIKGVALDPVRVDLVELPHGMQKMEALAFIKAHPDFQIPHDQALIQDKILEREPKPAKKPKAVKPVKAKKDSSTVRVKADKKVAPSLGELRVRAKKSEVTVEDVLTAFVSTTTTEVAQ